MRSEWKQTEEFYTQTALNRSQEKAHAGVMGPAMSGELRQTGSD